jgi:hypothetical protein
MSKLWVRVNYQAAASLVKGMRGFADALERLLDKAAVEVGSTLRDRRVGDKRTNKED